MKIFKIINEIIGRFSPLFEKQITLKKEHNGTSYGGWVISPQYLNKNSTIYSIGIGEDISFDISLIQKYKVDVHGFDPTPRSIEWIKKQKIPKQFHVHEYGIADYNGKAIFYPPLNPDHISHSLLERKKTKNRAIEVPVFRLETIMKMLKHDKIDLLKMDIEGAEYKVIEDIIKSNIHILQLLVEFHHGMDNITFKDTKKVIDHLEENGFSIFDISKDGRNYSFYKADWRNINEKIT